MANMHPCTHGIMISLEERWWWNTLPLFLGASKSDGPDDGLTALVCMPLDARLRKLTVPCLHRTSEQ